MNKRPGLVKDPWQSAPPPPTRAPKPAPAISQSALRHADDIEKDLEKKNEKEILLVI